MALDAFLVFFVSRRDIIVGMTRRDWFAVGIRLLGVWVLIGCWDEIRMLVSAHFELISTSTYTVKTYAVHAGFDLVAGIYLLAGAPQLMKAAFYRNAAPLCGNCGYDLTASPERCPECGSVRVKSE